MANLGSYLGLIGAAALVFIGNKYLNHRVKKEVKVYAEENISVSKKEFIGKSSKQDSRTESDAIDGERKIKNKGTDVRRSRVSRNIDSNNASNKLKSRKSNKAGKSMCFTAPRVEPI